MRRMNSWVAITGCGCGFLLIWITFILGHALHNVNRKSVMLTTSRTGSLRQGVGTGSLRQSVGTGSPRQGVIAYSVNYKQYHTLISPINQLNTSLDLVVLVPTHYSVRATNRRRVIRKTWANKTYTSPLKVQHVFVLGNFILFE